MYSSSLQKCKNKDLFRMARSKTIKICMCFLLSIFVHDKLQANIIAQKTLIVSILDWALGRRKVRHGKLWLEESSDKKS